MICSSFFPHLLRPAYHVSVPPISALRNFVSSAITPRQAPMLTVTAGMLSPGGLSAASIHSQQTVSLSANIQHECGQTICSISILSELAECKILDNTIGPEQDLKVIQAFEWSSRELVRRLHARKRNILELKRAIVHQAVAHAQTMKAVNKNACDCQRVASDNRNKRCSHIDEKHRKVENSEADLVAAQKTASPGLRLRIGKTLHCRLPGPSWHGRKRPRPKCAKGASRVSLGAR